MQEEDLAALADELNADVEAMKPRLHVVDFLGLIAGAVPFVLPPMNTSTSSYSSTTGGGFEVGTKTTKHVDYIALGGGAGAIICAIIGIALIGRMRVRALRFGVFAVLLALGVFQVIRAVLLGPLSAYFFS